MRSSRALGRLGIAAMALLVIPASMALGAWLASSRYAPEVITTAVVVPVTPVEFDDRHGVEVTPDWAEGASLYAPAWSGTVGRVTDADTLSTGDFVVSIDGVDRIALDSPEPFYRGLGLGASGTDVRWLHDALVSLGYLGAGVGPSDVFSEASLGGVRALARALGAAQDVEAFDPAWVVWLPDDPFPVASILVAAGQPAPAAGATLATQGLQLVGAFIRPLDGGQLTSGAGYLLSIGEVTVPLAEDGTVGGKALSTLGATLAPLDEVLQGTVHRAEPLHVWSVPTTALGASPNGQVCMWVVDHDAYTATEVTVLQSQAGFTYIAPLEDEPSVLANPTDVLDVIECPSS